MQYDYTFKNKIHFFYKNLEKKKTDLILIFKTWIIFTSLGATPLAYCDERENVTPYKPKR